MRPLHISAAALFPCGKRGSVVGLRHAQQPTDERTAGSRIGGIQGVCRLDRPKPMQAKVSKIPHEAGFELRGALDRRPPHGSLHEHPGGGFGQQILQNIEIPVPRHARLLRQLHVAQAQHQGDGQRSALPRSAGREEDIAIDQEIGCPEGGRTGIGQLGLLKQRGHLATLDSQDGGVGRQIA